MPYFGRRTSLAGGTGEFQIHHPYHSQGLAAGGSALLDAINRGKVHLAKFILDAGEYDIVNTRDFKGKTPLIRACYIQEEKTRDRTVELLLSRGAGVNLRDDIGRTAFSYACELRCNDVVRILVKNNGDPDLPDNKGNTPLIYSAIVGNDIAIEVIVRSFRRLGLNVDHINHEGSTALHAAAKNGFLGCAAILVVEGRANFSLRDRQTGLTAEELAKAGGGSLLDILPFSFHGGVWPSRAATGDELGDLAGKAAHPAAEVSTGGVRKRSLWNRNELDMIGSTKTAKSATMGGHLDSLTTRLSKLMEDARQRRSSLPSVRLRFDEDINDQHRCPSVQSRFRAIPQLTERSEDGGSDLTIGEETTSVGKETLTSETDQPLINRTVEIVLVPNNACAPVHNEKASSQAKKKKVPTATLR